MKFAKDTKDISMTTKFDTELVSIPAISNQSSLSLDDAFSKITSKKVLEPLIISLTYNRN
jgi:hypothetical protein